MTIIHTAYKYDDHPHDCLTVGAIQSLKFSAGAVPTGLSQRRDMVFRYLECYLQITGGKVDEFVLQTGEFKKIAVGFLGAINSPKFTEATVLWRYSMSKLWLDLLSHQTVTDDLLIKPSSKGLAPVLKKLVYEFESRHLDEEKVWLWRAWLTINQNGQKSFLPLYPVYARLGRAFTDKMYQTCSAYFGSRRSQLIPGMMSLTRFIGGYDEPIHANDFQCSEFMGTFWQKFFIYYVTTSYKDGKGAKITSIVTAWRSQIIFFIKEHLQASGLMAAPFGELPAPERKIVPGENTHLKKQQDGTQVRTKLLTNIPLEVTDEQAIQLLFHEIEHDVSLIRGWAKHACLDLWERCQRRQELAQAGKIRFVRIQRGGKSDGLRWLTNRTNPHCLANTCATFEHYQYKTQEQIDLTVLYPQPLNRTAEELGLPTTDSLLPHCFLLALEHPAITASFLEKHELYDKNGKLIGIRRSEETGVQLIGFKRRKGPYQALQTITLSQIAAETVEQIIKVTEPLRNWLREQGDEDWRYLLLTCGKSFGKPRRVAALSIGTSDPSRKTALAKSISKFVNVPEAEVSPLVERLSLPAARSSAAVLIYLKTKSVQKMSVALGHTDYSPRLLDRYLPKSIREFFQERWIRIFQAGIIVEALKESPHLLEASGFENLDKLHEFLSNHAIRRVSSDTSKPSNDESAASEQRTELAFNINADVLAALMTLDVLVKSEQNVDPRAKYWAEVGKQLVLHIEVNLQHRADLCSFVAEARLRNRLTEYNRF